MALKAATDTAAASAMASDVLMGALIDPAITPSETVGGFARRHCEKLSRRWERYLIASQNWRCFGTFGNTSWPSWNVNGWPH